MTPNPPQVINSSWMKEHVSNFNFTPRYHVSHVSHLHLISFFCTSQGSYCDTWMKRPHPPSGCLGGAGATAGTRGCQTAPPFTASQPFIQPNMTRWTSHYVLVHMNQYWWHCLLHVTYNSICLRKQYVNSRCIFIVLWKFSSYMWIKSKDKIEEITEKWSMVKK